MPCDTIRTVTVAAFSKLNFERLAAAAALVGLRVYRTSDVSSVEVTDGYRAASEQQVAQLRSAYAAETAKAGLKRFGWKIKTQVTETEERVGVVTRVRAGR